MSTPTIGNGFINGFPQDIQWRDDFWPSMRNLKLIYSGRASRVFTIETTNQKYAMKCCMKDLYDWKSEEKILKKIHHRNIIQQLLPHETEAVIGDDIYHIQMFRQYSTALFDYSLCARKKLILATEQYKESIETTAKAVLNGLKYLSDNGIVHRDIKDENVLLDLRDLAYSVIADFEFSVSTSSTLDQGCKITGTPTYLAPEILDRIISRRKEPYSASPSEDMWSFGHLLYNSLSYTELLTFDKKKPEVSLIRRKIEVITNGESYCFPRRSDITNRKLRDLLKKILPIQSQERISAGDALEHCYFSSSITRTLYTQRSLD